MLDQIENVDKPLWEQIKSFLENVAEMIRDTIQAYKNKKPNSPEGRIVQRMSHLQEQLQNAFAIGLSEGGHNYQRGGEVIADQSSVKESFVGYADDYYQIASEAQYNYSKEETGKESNTHKNVKVWHYFVNDIYFAEHDSEELKPYRVSINVKEKTDGHFFYSFSAEKMEGTSTQRTLHAAVNGSNNTTVNGSSSKKSIRYTSEKSTRNLSGIR